MRAGGGTWQRWAGAALLLAWVVPWAPAVRAQKIYGVEPGARAAAHQAIERCEQCHASRRELPAGRCLGCHGEIAQRLQAGRGLHASPLMTGQREECAACHKEHRGAGFDVAGWIAAGGRDAFRHELTGIGLNRAHARLGCEGCHVATRPGSGRQTFVDASADCTRPCHDHADQHGGTLGRACTRCHLGRDGEGAHSAAGRLDHGRDSAFPLIGRHAPLLAARRCVSCHQGAPAYFRGTPTRCGDAACHGQEVRADHGEGLHDRCECCHGTGGWLPARPTCPAGG